MKIAILTAIVFCVSLACTSTSDNRRTSSNQTPVPAAPANVPANTGAIPTPHLQDAPRISLADAKKDFDSGTAVFIDTHSADQFAKQHIPGALNISVTDLAAKENTIPKGKKIIAYCS